MSCLFKSLSAPLSVNTDELRRIIVSYLSTNPPLLDDLKAADIIQFNELGMSLSQYTRHMSDAQSWGGAIEIKAFCDLFKCNVTIHVLYTRKTFTFETSRGPPKYNIHIVYNGNHFEYYKTDKLVRRM